MRLPTLPIFGRVKLREGTTDDLFCLVALQPLSSSVPSEHTPFGTEKVNRVVDNALDQKLELPSIIQVFNSLKIHRVNRIEMGLGQHRRDP